MTLLLINGCNNKTINSSESSQNENNNKQEQNTEEQERNTKNIKKIQEFLYNTIDVNYKFVYDITIQNTNYNYSGQKYQNVIKGKKQNNIEYQIENNKFYNPKTKKEIENVYSEINSNLINLENYIYTLSNYTCVYSDIISVCEANDDNSNIIFKYNSNYIETIRFQSNNTVYLLNYSDYNTINPITMITYESKNINYDKTNIIQKLEITNEVDKPYTVYNYYIDNVTIKINDKLININEAYDILSGPMYYNAYINNIIDKENVQKVEQFIYDNNFIIIIVDVKNNNDIYYLTTGSYVEEILSQYLNNI